MPLDPLSQAVAVHPAGKVVPRRRPGLQWREIDGETVILDPARDAMHSLNATAAFIFQAVDGARSVQEIWEELATAFDVSPETAERDTRVLLSQLQKLQLIDQEPVGDRKR